MRGFGDLEAVIMEHLWARPDRASVRDVLEALQPTRPLAYTTVLTVMDNLHSKGFLARERLGRAHQYWPTRSRTDYAAELMGEALADSGNPTAALLRFVESMPPEEASRLRGALEDLGAEATDPGSAR